MLLSKLVRKRKADIIAEQVAGLPEPWRDTDIPVLPVAVLAEIADKERLAQISRMEGPLTDLIQEDVLRNGITGCGEVVLDATGRVCLRDGHHRMLICLRCGIEWMPVLFSASPRIRKEAMPIEDFLTLLGVHFKSLTATV